MRDEYFDGPGPRSGENPPRAAKAKPESPWAVIAIGLVLLGLAGRGASWVIGDSWQGLSTLGWATTQGVVIRTGLERTPGTNAGNAFTLKVAHRYTVGGKDYENDRIHFSETSTSGEEELYRRHLNARYPVDQPCTVYYNPRKPAESCLEPGTSVYLLAAIGLMSLLFLLGALGCFASGIRRIKATRAVGNPT